MAQACGTQPKSQDVFATMRSKGGWLLRGPRLPCSLTQVRSRRRGTRSRARQVRIPTSQAPQPSIGRIWEGSSFNVRSERITYIIVIVSGALPLETLGRYMS